MTYVKRVVKTTSILTHKTGGLTLAEIIYFGDHNPGDLSYDCRISSNPLNQKTRRRNPSLLINDNITIHFSIQVKICLLLTYLQSFTKTPMTYMRMCTTIFLQNL
ncbi:hypothetical protein ES288_A01G214200v1 [Gossypium darwinii]|uniref:Uncharacterized protein n=2 Tax=Gossypium TaxID=3633 RepID=A0A5D2RWP0_GOSTO|nr:hypothetical protein ES288_A01G214200v1 [Gossypium darwinii]TYI44215.1 hypothetical protein ES332_A01G221300v1 [Gossypium tomentosum]